MQQYLSVMKHAMFPYLSEEMHEGVADSRVKLVAELSPAAGTAAVWMRSPSGEAELSGMPVTPLLMHALRLNPIVGFRQRIQDPCK